MITPASILRLPIGALSKPRHLALIFGATSFAALACSSPAQSGELPAAEQPETVATAAATPEQTQVIAVVPDPTSTAAPPVVATVAPDPTATSEPVAEVQEDASSEKADDGMMDDDDTVSASVEPPPVSTDGDGTAKGGASEDDGDEPLAAVLRDLNPAGPKDVNPRLFQQLLPRDAIFPIYEPTLGAPEEAPLDPEELVIGVSIGKEARAYPIRPLRFREMVNDELGGVPILVTW